MSDEPDPPPPSEGDEEWWPGYPDIGQMYRHPAFTVQRQIGGYVEGGDWTRGSTGGTDTPQTAIRYPISPSVTGTAAAGQGVLYTRPYDYHTVEIFWGIPGKVADKWAEMAVIRSAFGYPDTVNDGQAIFHGYRTTMFPPDGDVPDDFLAPPLYDLRNPRKGGKGQLTSGRYYYYSLFFRMNLEWKRSFTSATLLPRNFGHSEHLWNTLPPYYQWIDDQQRDGEGDLRRFLRVFGFELDQTREFVEQWQELYHVDFCPVPLLRRLGTNFDVKFESHGIGDIRYRSLLSEIGLLYSIRGTRPCLEKVCEAVSKYECDVTQTGNLMTMPDDSDFFEGTGNWAGLNPALNPDTIMGSDVTILAPDKVFFKSSDLQDLTSHPMMQPPVGYGRGVMEVWTTEADEVSDVLITCGCGIAYDVYKGKDEDGHDILPYGARYIYPIQVGILADNKGVYSFSAQIKMPVTYPVDLMILWFDTEGAASATSFIARTAANPLAPTTANTWTPYQVIGEVPTDAVYAVPAIYLSPRAHGPDSPQDLSPIIYIAGAAVYNFGSAERISSAPPNPYLQLGNALEWIGPPTATPPPPLPSPYPGFPIGEK